MRFNLGKFGTEGNPREATTPENDVIDSETNLQPETAEEIDASRRNFVIGAAAAVAGSTFLGEEAEAARRPGESNLDYRDRSLRELEQHRQQRSAERIRDNRYGTRPGQQPETAPRIETKGAMTYIGFRPTEHEEKILGIRLYRLVPDAASIQISLHTDKQFGTQHLQMNVLRDDHSSFSVIGKPVFIDRNANQNMLLINRLLERLSEPTSPR